MNITGKKKNGQTFSVPGIAELLVDNSRGGFLFSVKDNEAESIIGSVCEPNFWKLIGYDEKNLKERLLDKIEEKK